MSSPNDDIVVRLDRIYTRGGDLGETSLGDGHRVAKHNARVAAYGTVDELNAALGVARLHSAETPADAWLVRIQNDLFDVGADLATPAESRWPGMQRVGDEEVTRLEGWIDQLNDELPPLKEFILPGGGPVGASFHQARTVCRRAERLVLALMDADPEVGDGVMRYLNRLSDYLFVAGRWAAKALGEPEHYWEKPGAR